MSGSDARLFHQLVARVEALEAIVEELVNTKDAKSDTKSAKSGEPQQGFRGFPPRDGKPGAA